MNTVQIHKILTRLLPQDKVNFLGVFSRDLIPSLNTINYPACFVANTDSSSKPGEHWVAFYLKSKHKVEFFDSYGFHSRLYGFTIPIDSYNHTQYQSFNSTLCGHFCILYLYTRIRCSCPLEKHFSKTNFKWNESKLTKWIRSLKLTNKPITHCTTNNCIQSCKCRNH